jgi:hypothetical protein
MIDIRHVTVAALFSVLISHLSAADKIKINVRQSDMQLGSGSCSLHRWVPGQIKCLNFFKIVCSEIQGALSLLSTVKFQLDRESI